MSRGKELAKNTAIVAVGKLSTKFVYFLLLPFYTAVLSTEDYGTVDLFNTYVALLLPIIVFQIEDALFRFMVDARDSEEEQKRVATTTFGFACIQIIVFSVVFVIIRNIVSLPYLGYLWLNVIASIFCGLFLQCARGLGDNQGYALGGFITASANIGLNLFFILCLDMRAEGMLCAAVISNFIGAFYLALRQRIWRQLKRKWFDTKLLKEILTYALPLVPNYLCWWVVGASDKSVVNYFLGISESGILAVSQKFSTAYSGLYSIFNLAWTESAALHRLDKDSNEYYSFIIERSFRLLSAVCTGIIAVVALAFPFLVNEKFNAAYYQVPIHMLGAFVYSVIGIYSVVYVAHKKTGGIAKTSFVAAVVNLVVHIGLIRHLGLYASSVSTLVAYFVMFMIRYFDIKKYKTIKVRKSVVFTSIAMMSVVIVIYYLQMMWLKVLGLCMALGFAIYLNKELLREIKTTILNKRLKKSVG